MVARQEEDATVDLSFNLATICCLHDGESQKKRYLRDTDFSLFPVEQSDNVRCIEFRISKLVPGLIYMFGNRWETRIL